MHGSRRSGVGSGVQTTSSVENSNLINSHNKSLKTGFGLPHLKKLNYPSPPPPQKKSGSAHAKHVVVVTIEILLFSY